MDDEFQSILAAQALGFQNFEDADPIFGVFAFGQLPMQDLRAVRVGPDAHGDENRTLETSFDRPFAAPTVSADFAIGPQDRHPDGIDLQDGWYIVWVAVRFRICELMQALVRGTQGQRANVQVGPAPCASMLSQIR